MVHYRSWKVKIESTVLGNDAPINKALRTIAIVTFSRTYSVLHDHSQVYLPVYNALHSLEQVCGYQKHLRQVIQHIAS